MALATLTKTGRAAIALAISSRPLHLAWGSGDPAWDADGATLPSLVDSTALLNELGRRTPSHIGFVEPDEAGGIVIPVSTGSEGAVQEARYRLVTEPTPYPPRPDGLRLQRRLQRDHQGNGSVHGHRVRRRTARGPALLHARRPQTARPAAGGADHPAAHQPQPLSPPDRRVRPADLRPSRRSVPPLRQSASRTTRRLPSPSGDTALGTVPGNFQEAFMPNMPDSYYDNFNASKNYEKILYRDGYTLQGAELNEAQSAAMHRLQGVADALFKDGDIIRDAGIIVNKETGEVRAQSGAVYLRGAVRGVPDPRPPSPSPWSARWPWASGSRSEWCPSLTTPPCTTPPSAHAARANRARGGCRSTRRGALTAITATGNSTSSIPWTTANCGPRKPRPRWTHSPRASPDTTAIPRRAARTSWTA